MFKRVVAAADALRNPPVFGWLTLANIVGICTSFVLGSFELFFLFFASQAAIMIPDAK